MTITAGIGTYSKGANENAGSLQFLPKTRAWLFATLDQMFGISFVDHVLGGYKFVMRYYGRFLLEAIPEPRRL